MTADAQSRVEQVSCLLLLFLSNRRNGRDRREYRNKNNENAQGSSLLGWYVGSRKNVQTDGRPARRISDSYILGGQGISRLPGVISSHYPRDHDRFPHLRELSVHATRHSPGGAAVWMPRRAASRVC
jgi:hypothetical protein